MHLNQEIKNIWVMGLGGVGGYFGGLIAHTLNEIKKQQVYAKQRVYFIARGQHLQEIRENGLILQRNNDSFVCVPDGAAETPGFRRPDLILVCVKSYDLDSAILSLRKFINDDTIIIPLLNGLDIYQRVRKLLDKGIVLPACVYITSYIESPGKVAQNGPDGRVVMGKDPLFPDFDPSNLLAFSHEMGLNFNWLDDPYVSIWEKYLLVGSFALVTAASGLSFGEVVSDPEAKANLIGVMQEIIRLGQKQGIDLKMNLIDKTIAFIGLYPHDARSSYQRDLEQARGQDEGDIFGAAIIRMGKELNIRTPITERMLGEIKRRFNTDAKIASWIHKYPGLDPVCRYQPVFWVNDLMTGTEEAFAHLAVQYPRLNEPAIREAEARLLRFAPLVARLFPETQANRGIIESETVDISALKCLLEEQYDQTLTGRLLMKCDSHLPVAGSIKARGGIYAVLKHAEDLAMKNGILEIEEDYAMLAEDYFKVFYNQFSLAVGSTGNLGLSVGITGAALGFKTVIHMSQDAKAWKKDLLRSLGVEVMEYEADYSQAVEAGRRQSQQDLRSYFIDDESSVDLFLGYSVAALRLKEQLETMNVKVDREHPLFVYLPCGVGGAPGGVCFGLKNVFGDYVHCFFAEPTHCPCVLIGLMTGANDKLSVFDVGLDNLTEADGLAVGRASGFVSRVIGELVSGVYTVEDDDLFRLLAMLADSEQINIEPSAAIGLLGPVKLAGSEAGREYIRKHNLEMYMQNAAHIAWATGGLLVPEEQMQAFYQQGKELLKL